MHLMFFGYFSRKIFKRAEGKLAQDVEDTLGSSHQRVCDITKPTEVCPSLSLDTVVQSVTEMVNKQQRGY